MCAVVEAVVAAAGSYRRVALRKREQRQPLPLAAAAAHRLRSSRRRRHRRRRNAGLLRRKMRRRGAAVELGLGGSSRRSCAAARIRPCMLDDIPGELASTQPDSGTEFRVESVVVQPLSDGFGACSLSRLTRVLNRACASETRPKEKVSSTANVGPSPRRPGALPRCLASESLALTCAFPRRPPSHAVRVWHARDQTSALVGFYGTGSASMPTIWSINLRKPFGCALPYAPRR